MNLVDAIREALRQQRSWYDRAEELSEEQLYWRPAEGGCHIGFVLWHYVRTEDNIIQFILQNRKPTVWIEGGYFERFGLDRISQGTGMSLEDAAALRLPPIEQWMEYQRAVWRATDEYLATIKDSDLERIVKIAGFGEIPAGRALMTILVTHGFTHLGEINHLRTLQGLPSLTI